MAQVQSTIAQSKTGTAKAPTPAREFQSTLRSGTLSTGYVAGALVGAAAAPSLFAFAFARGLRDFHPDGETVAARFVAERDDAFAARLAGPALVRFSPSVVRHLAEGPDVLGCAVRFRRVESLDDPSLRPGDQDLLAATIRSFLRPEQAVRSTHQHDYLANVYWSVARYAVPGHGIGTLRWVGRTEETGADGTATTRSAKLDAAMASAAAQLTLEFVDASDTSHVLGVLQLERRLQIDQEALRMSPFHDGQGLSAVGFLNGIRRVAYWASQSGRGLRRALNT